MFLNECLPLACLSDTADAETMTIRFDFYHSHFMLQLLGEGNTVCHIRYTNDPSPLEKVLVVIHSPLLNSSGAFKSQPY